MMGSTIVTQTTQSTKTNKKRIHGFLRHPAVSARFETWMQKGLEGPRNKMLLFADIPVSKVFSGFAVSYFFGMTSAGLKKHRL